MNFTTILKGCLGLALIYLICVPLTYSQIGKAERAIETTIPKQKVEFSPTCRARSISPDGKKFIDGYFSVESGECLAKKRGRMKV